LRLHTPRRALSSALFPYTPLFRSIWPEANSNLIEIRKSPLAPRMPRPAALRVIQACLFTIKHTEEPAMSAMMKAAVFVEPGRIEVVDKRIPDVGPNDALIRITTTTICGTDVHILKGEYPVAKGLTIGHEPVGVIEKLGSAVQGYQEGQRVIAGAICPNFNSYAAQDGVASQDGSY